MWLEAGVDVGIAGAYLHGCDPRIVVDGDAPHLFEVDQEPLGGRVTGVVVSSRAYGDRNAVLAGPQDRLADVGGVETAGDPFRTHVRVAAIKGEMQRAIGGVTRAHERASQLSGELIPDGGSPAPAQEPGLREDGGGQGNAARTPKELSARHGAHALSESGALCNLRSFTFDLVAGLPPQVAPGYRAPTSRRARLCHPSAYEYDRGRCDWQYGKRPLGHKRRPREPERASCASVAPRSAGPRSGYGSMPFAGG